MDDAIGAISGGGDGAGVSPATARRSPAGDGARRRWGVGAAAHGAEGGVHV